MDDGLMAIVATGAVFYGLAFAGLAIGQVFKYLARTWEALSGPEKGRP